MIENIVFIATSILFFIFLVRNSIYWLYLWQVKEYRFDRLYIHLRETEQGRFLLFGAESIAKVFIFFLYFLTIPFPWILQFYPFIVLWLYIYLTAKIIYDAINRRILFPVLTPKIIGIFLVSFLLESFLYTFPVFDISAWMVFLDKLLPFSIGFLILLSSVPSDFYKDSVINRAIKKIRKFRKLLVIGITGSYGKGSTKEYLYTVLSHKFDVLKTHSTYNTPIGISRTILSELDRKKKIFVVEMGAYKVGDIAYMSKMVKPTIGILTAVNDQHLSLFGSQENIMKAKYELIQSLPKKGLALFNGNNEKTFELFKKNINKQKALYFSTYKGIAPRRASIIADDVVVKRFFTEFSVRIKRKELGKFKLNLIGAHHIENVLPAIYIGSYLKMTEKELQNAVGKIRPSLKTTYPYVSKEGVVFIDDTYNANPDAVKAAVDYMRIYHGRKILVLQPMIELGKNANQDHYNTALYASEVCDVIITTNSNFEDEIKKGVEDGRNNCQVYVMSPGRASAYIRQSCGKDDIVVFEGKEAAYILNSLEYFTAI